MQKPWHRWVIVAAQVLLLSGCATTPHQVRDSSTLDAVQSELEQANQAAQEQRVTAPGHVSDALMPALPVASLLPGGGEERFDLVVEEMPARQFFMSLVKDTHYNVVVHPEVSGSVSLDLRGVTVAEVMQVAADIFGYPHKRVGNLYQVFPAGLRTELFQIDYLNLDRRGVSQTAVSSGQVSNAGTSSSGSSQNNDDENDDDAGDGESRGSGVIGTQIQTSTEANFWRELKETLVMLIGYGEGRRVVITPQAGMIAVRAFPAELEVVESYLRKAELIMRRQVVLETKILEVSLNEGFQSGIEWSSLKTPGSKTSFLLGGSSVPLNNPDLIGGVFGLTATTGDFTAIIELLETQGSVQVLSSPRISTVNNQKAVIKVGTDEFFVTEISNTTTTSSGTTTNNPEVELTPFFSGIALDVTPQISEDDEIILHVHPSVSEVKDQTKVINFGGQSIELPLALSTIRESDSIVFSRNNQVVVLGGLMQTRSDDTNAGLPGTGKIPLLGHLFNQQRSNTVKSELVILLKPIIVGPEGSPELVEESKRRIEGFRAQLKSGSR